jgi:hypothetical protein
VCVRRNQKQLFFFCFSASRKRRKNAILFSEFSGFGFAYFWKKMLWLSTVFWIRNVFFSGQDPALQLVSDPDPFTDPAGFFSL